MQPLHTLRLAEVFESLETSAEGLTSHEAASRLAFYGHNALADPKTTPLWKKFISQVAHPMALMLIAVGVLSIIFYDAQRWLGVLILFIVLLNASFAFWQEYRAATAVNALRKLLPAYARVIRDGQELKVLASDVVPGDVLVLAEGDNISADARVIEEYGMRTNNATLTGEATPSRKTAEASLREGLTEVERPNLIFAGTSVFSGTARAVVFATGMTTQFGRIAYLTQSVREEPSPLMQETRRMTTRITYIAIGLGLLIFYVIVGYLEQSWWEGMIFALGVIVAVIPEGLRPTLTLTLAMAVRRLAKRHVLVKQLAAVETLGTISVLCTDKSGTLTQNQMTAREVWVSRQKIKVSGVGYEPSGKFSSSPRDLDQLLTAASLCNNSRLNPPTLERPQWSVLGDQTEAALRVLAIKGGINENDLNTTLPRVHELPFDARRKRMTTLHRGEIAFVKGAPKEILQLCTRLMINGEEILLDNLIRSEILAANDDYARAALRVLAFARRQLPPRDGVYTSESVERDLTFIGLVGMMDPPRPEIENAIKRLRDGKVRLVMITGDYGLTAESLARRVGMLTSDSPRILTGGELDAMTEPQVQSALNEEIIFARMAPEHKMRLIDAFQVRGDVVAMSGDGVNDAPALRKADIGIAMGITGSDVAKEAADVILTDDNFADIVSAIEEGRAVYDNIRKFITYIFSSNVPQIIPFILSSLFGWLPLALSVFQILIIDAGTDILPALALGTEQPEPTVMDRKPRRRGQPLLGARLFIRALWLGVIETVLCYIGFAWVYYSAGYISLPLLPTQPRSLLPEVTIHLLASTVYFIGVLAAQMGNAVTCRTEVDRVHELGWWQNRFLLAGLALQAILIGGLVAVFFLPIHPHPVPTWSWGLLIFYPITVYGLDRIRKTFIRHYLQSGDYMQRS